MLLLYFSALFYSSFNLGLMELVSLTYCPFNFFFLGGSLTFVVFHSKSLLTLSIFFLKPVLAYINNVL